MFIGLQGLMLLKSVCYDTQNENSDTGNSCMEDIWRILLAKLIMSKFLMLILFSQLWSPTVLKHLA